MLKQEELEVKGYSEEKLRFKAAVSELTTAKKDFPIEDEDSLCWSEVFDPESRSKEHDPEYVEAYKTVLRGERDSPNYGLTLRELLDQFTAQSIRENQITQGTLKRYAATTKLFVTFINKRDIPIVEIPRATVFDFINHQRSRLAGGTIHGHISRLKTMWEYAYNHSLVTGDNPFARHKLNAERGQNKKQPFTSEEMLKLLDVIKDEPSSMRLLVWLGYFTGARISELVSLRIDSIKLEDGVNVFTILKGKTDAAARINPIPTRCSNLFNQVKKEATAQASDYLFHDLIHFRDPDRPAYQAGKDFGYIKCKHITTEDNKGFHSFRVMFATAAQQADVSESLAAHLIGHGSKGSTMTYGYYSKGYEIKQLLAAQEKAINKLELKMGTSLIEVK
jgi:site-specific recombinase XerD